MKYSAVIVAAGKSTRFSGKTNKLLYKLSDGLTVLEHSLKLFREDPDCQQIIVVTSPQTIELAASHPNWRETYCMGGQLRCQSVYKGLMAVNQKTVLIHDGARCYLLKEDLQQLKDALVHNQGAILTRSCTDTMKQVKDGFVVKSVDRRQLNRALTPQGFRTESLLKAYRKALKENFEATDEASVMERFSNVRIKCVEAIGSNEKVTTIDDIR